MKRTARIARCYTDQTLQANTQVLLDKRSSHHLSTVLRTRIGQSVQLFNGDGKNYEGIVTSTGKKTNVDISSVTDNELESALHISLVQAIARGDKMDGIVQKVTELGVDVVQPVYTKHSIAKLEPSREARKLTHWRSVAISASEQSGRSRLPEVMPVLTLDDYLNSYTPAKANEQHWVLSPTGEKVLNSFKSTKPGNNAIEDTTKITLLIGPESGFDTDELQSAKVAGFHSLRIGPRVLRTETAGPACIAIVQSHFGDMN